MLATIYTDCGKRTLVSLKSMRLVKTLHYCHPFRPYRIVCDPLYFSVCLCVLFHYRVFGMCADFLSSVHPLPFDHLFLVKLQKCFFFCEIQFKSTPSQRDDTKKKAGRERDKEIAWMRLHGLLWIRIRQLLQLSCFCVWVFFCVQH